MKLILLCLMVGCLATDVAEVQDSKDSTILRYDSVSGITGYHFFYETSGGTLREETAELRNPDTKDETLVVWGTISWLDNGTRFNLSYVADDKGFQPVADHLPKLLV